MEQRYNKNKIGKKNMSKKMIREQRYNKDKIGKKNNTRKESLFIACTNGVPILLFGEQNFIGKRIP